ncbi:MAG: TonB-dependent receptor [Pseudomonadales bacterium]|nr:TonB-dependent receptor [Pseudomonadales bacterium]
MNLRMPLLFLTLYCSLCLSSEDVMTMPVDQPINKRAIDYFDLPLHDIFNIQVRSASRFEQNIFHAPSAISIIHRGEILRSPAHTIPELLQYVVGIDAFTKTYSDMDVAARGRARDETSKMLVMIDGQVVNVVPYMGMQWPTLPISLDDIERIEILRGVGTGVYTATSQVGVIQIYTLAAAQRDAVKLSSTYGEAGTHQNALHLSQQISNNFVLAATLSYVQTEKEGDKEAAEVGNWHIKDSAKIKGLTFRGDYNRQDFSYQLSGGMTSGREGYNASPGDYSLDRSEKESLFFSHWFNQDLSNTDNINLRIGYRTLRQRNERFEDNQYVFKYQLRNGDGLDVDLQYNIARLEGHQWMLGLNYVALHASREINNLSGPYVYDEKDTLYAVYIQDQFLAFNDRLQLTLGGRYDQWNDIDQEWTPRVVANVFLIPNKLVLRLASTTSFRRQNFDESFYYTEFGPPDTGWFKGSTITATTNNTGEFIAGGQRESEKMLAHEIGLRWQYSPQTMITTEYYYNKVSDIISLIVYDTVTVGTTAIPNLGATTIDEEVVYQGLELESKSQWSDNTRFFLNYTYQWAEDGQGHDLKNLPKNKVSTGIQYYRYFDFDIRARYVSEVTYLEVPGIEVASYTSLDIAISKRINRQFFMKLSVLNLLDEKHYEYPIYTQIGRKALLTLKFSF